MPSRKKSESSSLRRLSSIASLHTLNPFRRRSQNNTDIIASSSSNISLTSSTAANPPEPWKQLSSSELLGEYNNNTSLPPLPRSQPDIPARRSSYVCIPDDPIGGMPRSRTFSNLPLPTRVKDNITQSKSHVRFPSNVLSNTRLPSPKFSTRKHSISRLNTLDHNITYTKKKGNHSDTEPLLRTPLERSASIHCTTAFKENMPLGPIKPLPGMDIWDEEALFSSSPPFQTSSRLPSPIRQSHHARSSPPSASLPRRITSLDHAGLPQTNRQEFKSRIRLGEKLFRSSPGYHSTRDRVPTPAKPGHPVQRWSSQPALSNKANLRPSHGEIKQTRLLSARQAPTPPPPKAPLSSEDLNLIRLKSSTSGHLSHVSEQSSTRGADGVVSRSSQLDSMALNNSIGVHSAEPLEYWTGRFSSLNDRYRNEELLTSLNIGAPILSSTDWKSKSETDRIHSSEANMARMRRAIEFLYMQCATEPARQSFLRWQRRMALTLDSPELAKPVGGRSCALEMSLKEEENDIPTPLSSTRKLSIMNRLFSASRAKKGY